MIYCTLIAVELSHQKQSLNNGKGIPLQCMSHSIFLIHFFHSNEKCQNILSEAQGRVLD